MKLLKGIGIAAGIAAFLSMKKSRHHHGPPWKHHGPPWKHHGPPWKRHHHGPPWARFNRGACAGGRGFKRGRCGKRAEIF